MTDRTKIAWTDSTWNALRGCSRVSEGCKNCYAEGIAARFSKPGLWGHEIAEMQDGKARWTGKVVLDEKALLKPLRWKKPRRIFVTSIGDPFHEAVTDDMLDRLFTVMALCPQHTFQLLTKRPERMREYVSHIYERHDRCWDVSQRAVYLRRDRRLLNPDAVAHEVFDALQHHLPNLWIGTSVENQATADERIPHLLATPAAVRFLSCEPLIGPVDLGHCIDDLPPNYWITWLDQLDWVICGGESGPKARPMHPDWVRGLRDQCAAADVTFFFKQWGEFSPVVQIVDTSSHTVVSKPLDNGKMLRVGSKAAGRVLDGEMYDGFPRATPW